MTQRDPAFDCLFNTISGFLLPFFLAGAAGSTDAARNAIAALINAYNPCTTAELDLVGRVIGFGTVAMDNLRLSMTEGLSDTKVLRYRSSAVSLSRAAEQARKILQAMQQHSEVTQDTPRPKIVAAPAPKPALSTPAESPQPLPFYHDQSVMPPLDIEAMKRDARMMIAAFSKHGASRAAMQTIPDTATAVGSAARAAVAAATEKPSAVTAARPTVAR